LHDRKRVYRYRTVDLLALCEALDWLAERMAAIDA
jgi:hypothetical protein